VVFDLVKTRESEIHTHLLLPMRTQMVGGAAVEEEVAAAFSRVLLTPAAGTGPAAPAAGA
jgi:hypothetical protein